MGRGTRLKDHETLISLAPYPWIKERDPRCAANGPGHRNQACAFQHSEGSSFRVAVHAPRIKGEGVGKGDGFAGVLELGPVPNGQVGR